MGSRKTGEFNPPEEIVVLTCDVCERDIGYLDGRRPAPHLRLTRHPNGGSLDDQAPAVVLCSKQCLCAYAEGLTGLDRTSRSSADSHR
jgi:hypothetical protein